MPRGPLCLYVVTVKQGRCITCCWGGGTMQGMNQRACHVGAGVFVVIIYAFNVRVLYLFFFSVVGNSVGLIMGTSIFFLNYNYRKNV